MAFKLSSILSLALAASTVSGHAFFHTGYVNGKSQGHLFGVRAPQSNSPIQDVSSSAMACNSPLNSPVSKDVISVAPGDKFGIQWNHNIAGPSPGDGDDPIAGSHKGPVIAYMAKVDDASSATGAGLKWVKVAEEGLDTSTGKWGVDTMIANAGLWSFTMPSLAPGDYLLRGEIIALHSAGSSGEAQFYMSCAAVRVTGSGTCAPSNTVSFPGAYSAADPGILISIYGNTGKPDNGGKPYKIPGPAVASCGASSGSPQTTRSVAISSTSATIKISATPTTAGNVISKTSAVATTAATTVATTAATTSPRATYAASPTTLRTVTGRPTTPQVPSSSPVKTNDAPSIPSTSATSPSGPGFPMTGPSGRRFVCYEL